MCSTASLSVKAQGPKQDMKRQAKSHTKVSGAVTNLYFARDGGFVAGLDPGKGQKHRERADGNLVNVNKPHVNSTLTSVTSWAKYNEPGLDVIEISFHVLFLEAWQIWRTKRNMNTMAWQADSSCAERCGPRTEGARGMCANQGAHSHAARRRPSGRRVGKTKSCSPETVECSWRKKGGGCQQSVVKSTVLCLRVLAGRHETDQCP